MNNFLGDLPIYVFLLSPLLAPAIAVYAHGGSWRKIRGQLFFAAGYVVLAMSGFCFVWYCRYARYEDWIMAFIVPYGVAFLALPASWLLFFLSFRERGADTV